MDKMHVIWVFLWVLFGFVHSFLANNYIKSSLQKFFHLNMPAYRVGYNSIAVVSLCLLMYFHYRMSSPVFFEATFFSDVLSALLMLTGGTMMVWSILIYFKQHSGLYLQSNIPALQTTGMHSAVRHPLYLGTLIFLAGTTLFWPMQKNILAFIIIFFYTLTGAWLEEKKLVKIFGSDYEKYQKKVPMLLPRFGIKKLK